MSNIRHPNRSVPFARAATPFSRIRFLRALQERADRRRAIREQEEALLDAAWAQIDAYDQALWADWDTGLARAQRRREEEVFDV
jgi:hypothetical protein